MVKVRVKRVVLIIARPCLAPAYRTAVTRLLKDELVIYALVGNSSLARPVPLALCAYLFGMCRLICAVVYAPFFGMCLGIGAVVCSFFFSVRLPIRAVVCLLFFFMCLIISAYPIAHALLTVTLQPTGSSRMSVKFRQRQKAPTF